MKREELLLHMEAAVLYSSLSKCKRAQVGCLIVKDRNVISIGVNGTPIGFCNKCEDHEGKTKGYVLHAETNAISKISRSTLSSDGCTSIQTLSPCMECAKLLYQSGIKGVFFKDLFWRDPKQPIEFLRDLGVECAQI